MLLLQGDKQGKVIEPARFLLAEPFERGACDLLRASCFIAITSDETFVSSLRRDLFEVAGLVESGFVSQEINLRQIGLPQQPLFDELFEADERRVASEGRKTLIRRIGVAGWPQRQHLPPALPRSHQLIDPAIRGRSQVTDSVWAR